MEKNKNHILIVDDDDKIRNLLKDYLTENHYIVSTAEDAIQAKERLKIIKFDIIILDVMMPGQDGYDLTKEIKKDSKVPIILLTAKGEVENRIKGLELGADDYLGKPFEPKELLLRIKNILTKKNKIDLKSQYNIGRAQVGIVTSGCLSTVLNKNIALCRIDAQYSEIGTEVEIGKIDGHQKRISAKVVRFPFYDPDKTRVRA